MDTWLESLGASFSSGPAAASAFATIDVLDRFDHAHNDWIELSEQAPVSPYQSYPFQSRWFETLGRAEDVTPFLIIARDAAGRPRALLPLCIQKRAGLRIALFLGGRESNFNLPLLRADAAFDERSLRALIAEAARCVSHPPDLVYLRNQPRRFEGVDNPLAFVTARPSPSYAYSTTLPARVDELTARLSKDSRKKLRKKEARLAEMGDLSYEHCARGERAAAILAALVRQKSARFYDMGVSDFDRPAVPELLRSLSSESGEGSLEVHGLSMGGRIVATYAGIVRRGRFSAMLNSYDMEEAIARCSPGELLLHALMRNLVSRGMSHFDLGAGEARYKNSVCDETVELCDVVLPVSARGVVAAPFFSAYLQLKRRAKQTPLLARAFYRSKRLIRSG